MLKENLDKNSTILKLIAKEGFDILSEEERHALENWLQQSPENRQKLEHFRERLNNDLRKGKELKVNEEWEVFEKRYVPAKRSRKVWYYAAVAMVAGVCFCVGIIQKQKVERPLAIVHSVAPLTKSYKAVLVLNDGSEINITDSTGHMLVLDGGGSQVKAFGNRVTYDEMKSVKSEGAVEYNTLIVPRGGEYQLQMADGTQVWLNSESKLRYPVRFTGATREVEMEGEVCFKVVKNEQQPFIVRTKDVAVEVLGTFFNIESYANRDVVTTTLVEGRVNVSNGKKSYILNPDQQIVAKNGDLQMKQVNAKEYISWTQGMCLFTEASLDEIMTKLACWYDVEVFFTNDLLRDAHFSIEIKRYDDIAIVLSKIEKTGRVKFKVKGRTVIVEE